MAGYLLAILAPLGFGTVARSWLIARREGLELTAVLATVALDRLTDGLVFAFLVPAAFLLVAFPDPTGGIRTGLTWGATGSVVLFSLLLLALAAYRRGAATRRSGGSRSGDEPAPGVGLHRATPSLRAADRCAPKLDSRPPG